MGWSENPVKRATVKKASIRNNLRFQCSIVANGGHGRVEAVKRSAETTTNGALADVRLRLPKAERPL
jgi:hypothetical protein